MRHVKHDLIQNSPEWYAFRRNGVGGSEIAGIMGIEDAYNTRNEIMREKLHGPKQLSDFAADLYNKGHAWEFEVRQSLAQSLNCEINPAVVSRTDNSRMFASLDGITPDGATLFEIKSTEVDRYWNDLQKHGVVRQIWMAQVQWGLFVSGARHAYLAVVHRGNGQVTMTEIKPDVAWFERMVPAAESFLADLDTQRALDLDGLYLKRIERIKRVITRANDRVEALKAELNQLAERALNASGAKRIEGQTLSIAWQERAGNINFKAIPQLEGVDLEKYRGKPSRFIKVTIKGESNE